ncbi:flagellar biosynthesis anti-sigma factor FlgM [Brevibacillus ginsengisoli]|uniref:flagellar biosynthesis anti-sigma factor FlgM n=1 Tax=Brevibacillus ginsengisoli TaxID=363854 RepID=UPI003CED4CB7
MRINEPNRTGMINAYNKTGKLYAAQNSKKPMGKDEVQISNEALELLKKGEVKETAPTDKTKLNELKAKIEQGTYHVPSDKIAEKFLSFWKKP